MQSFYISSTISNNKPAFKFAIELHIAPIRHENTIAICIKYPYPRNRFWSLNWLLSNMQIKMIIINSNDFSLHQPHLYIISTHYHRIISDPSRHAFYIQSSRRLNPFEEVRAKCLRLYTHLNWQLVIRIYRPATVNSSPAEALKSLSLSPSFREDKLRALTHWLLPIVLHSPSIQ